MNSTSQILILSLTDRTGGASRGSDTNRNAYDRFSVRYGLSRAGETNDHLVLGSLDKGSFADLAACAEFYRGNTNYPEAPPTASSAEVILTALGKFEAEFQELREAAAGRPYSRFPIQYGYEPPWNILLPHLAEIKRLTRLTHVRATAEL